MNDIYERISSITPARIVGHVVRTEGMTISASGFPVPIGAIGRVSRREGDPLFAEAIAFSDDLTVLYTWSDLTGIRPGSKIELVRTVPWLPTGEELLGRVIDAFGRVIDAGSLPVLPDYIRYDQKPPAPCDRPPIKDILSTGIRAIDGLLTCGCGQRIGIFAGSGVGKSVTLGMMTRYTDAEVIVLGLIGERGREVNEFIERELGEEGRKKSVVVVSTSNDPPLMRVRAAEAAMSIAEYFRDKGKKVLFLMDSLTRYAMAQREIGLAAGEPPTARGYTPSVFTKLPKLVERAGQSRQGSITAFFTVLVEGDDIHEPICDAVRGLLDGHIWLSRDLSSRGHYPAIDILGSISRLMPNICSKKNLEAAQNIRKLLGIYRDNEDLITLGAYKKGTDPNIDKAIEMKTEIEQFLCQGINERSSYGETAESLNRIVG